MDATNTIKIRADLMDTEELFAASNWRGSDARRRFPPASAISFFWPSAWSCCIR